MGGLTQSTRACGITIGSDVDISRNLLGIEYKADCPAEGQPWITPGNLKLTGFVRNGSQAVLAPESDGQLKLPPRTYGVGFFVTDEKRNPLASFTIEVTIGDRQFKFETGNESYIAVFTTGPHPISVLTLHANETTFLTSILLRQTERNQLPSTPLVHKFRPCPLS